MKVKSRKHYLGWIFAGLWVVGIICLISLIASIVNDTRRLEKVQQEVSITQPTNGKLYVRVDEPELSYTGDMWWMDNDGRGWDLTEDTLKLSDIKVRVTKSEDSSYAVIVWKYGRGFDRGVAKERASKVVYHASYADSVLNLGSGFAIDQHSKFRGQKVLVEIRVPVGKKIQFDESVVDKFNDVHIRFRSSRHNNRNYDWDDDEYFDWRPNIEYTMTSSGELNAAGETITDDNNDENYRYREDSIQLQREYEDQKRKAEDEQQRLKEMEDKMKNQKKQSTTVTGSVKDETISFIRPYIFTLS
jgi:hypothetical protein